MGESLASAVEDWENYVAESRGPDLIAGLCSCTVMLRNEVAGSHCLLSLFIVDSHRWVPSPGEQHKDTVKKRLTVPACTQSGVNRAQVTDCCSLAV